MGKSCWGRGSLQTNLPKGRGTGWGGSWLDLSTVLPRATRGLSGTPSCIVVPSGHGDTWDKVAVRVNAEGWTTRAQAPGAPCLHHLCRSQVSQNPGVYTEGGGAGGWVAAASPLSLRPLVLSSSPCNATLLPEVAAATEALLLPWSPLWCTLAQSSSRGCLKSSCSSWRPTAGEPRPRTGCCRPQRGLGEGNSAGREQCDITGSGGG